MSSYVSYALIILSASWMTVETEEISELVVIDGFPSSIPCTNALPRFYHYRAKPDAVGECRITKNDEVIFNMNITWLERHRKGADFMVNIRWNGSAVNVSAEWGGKSFSREYVINVRTPTVSTCNSNAKKSLSAKIGTSQSFYCPMQENMRRNFTEEELHEFHVTWYRDCVAISTNDTKYSYGEWGTSYITGGLYHSFNSLRVLNTSLYDVGAVFKCVVRYRNSSFEANRGSLVFRVSRSYIAPEIVEESSKRVVSRGKTVNISCSWRYTYTDMIPVLWEKGGRRICGNDVWPCSLVKIKSAAEDNASSPFDLMTSVLTLSNVGDSDTGLYICLMLAPSGVLSTNTSVTLLPERKVTVATIVSATILAILFLVMVMLFIYIWKRIEILYFYKKKFAKYVETEKPITYLIYGDDSYIIDNDCNPVNDVSNWLTTRGVAFCDQSKGKEWSDTGAPIADRSIALMGQCLSLTIFLTPSLLNDNTLELFKSYSGFEENIRKKNFPIVFVCTKDFEKRITNLAKSAEGINDDDLKAGNSQETYRTFAKFMRRNIVIHWFPRNDVKFYRSLYVALPKVAERKRIPVDEA